MTWQTVKTRQDKTRQDLFKFEYYKIYLNLNISSYLNSYICNKTLIRLLLLEESDLGQHCLLRPDCPKTWDFYGSTGSQI